jgi:hypothetical protein
MSKISDSNNKKLEKILIKQTIKEIKAFKKLPVAEQRAELKKLFDKPITLGFKE